MRHESGTLCWLLGIVLVGSAMGSPASAEADERRRGRRGPPPEAIEACEALEEGASCTVVTRRRGELTGTCDVRRELLVCVPEGFGRRGRGPQGPPDEGPPDDANEPLSLE